MCGILVASPLGILFRPPLFYSWSSGIRTRGTSLKCQDSTTAHCYLTWLSVGVTVPPDPLLQDPADPSKTLRLTRGLYKGWANGAQGAKSCSTLVDLGCPVSFKPYFPELAPASPYPAGNRATNMATGVAGFSPCFRLPGQPIVGTYF